LFVYASRIGTCSVYAYTSSLRTDSYSKRDFCRGIVYASRIGTCSVYAYTSSLRTDSYSKRDALPALIALRLFDHYGLHSSRDYHFSSNS